jgi:tRNA 2-selenouridine synthase SelU
MKERISKYVRDGAKVSYKYKKSLAQIEKRKRQNEDMYTQRSLSLREQMRSKMSLIITEASKAKVPRLKTEGAGDIFCQILENEKDSIKRVKEQEYTSSRKRNSKTVLSTNKLEVK